MKKLTRIHLHNLSQAELAKKEENLLKGGFNCACAGGAYCPCAYAGKQTDKNDSYHGGSGTVANSEANFFEQVTNKNHG